MFSRSLLLMSALFSLLEASAAGGSGDAGGASHAPKAKARQSAHDRLSQVKGVRGNVLKKSSRNTKSGEKEGKNDSTLSQ